MGNDCALSTVNQANKKTTCFRTSSNIIALTVEINTTNTIMAIMKLQTENINDNIKNTSSDDSNDNKEIEHVKTIPGTSMRNRATKIKLNYFMLNQIKKGNRLPYDVISLAVVVLKALDSNGISSHKEERILGKFNLFLEEKEFLYFLFI